MEVVPLNVANATAALAREDHRAERERNRARVRSRYDLRQRGLVLSLGRLHPFKGIHLLVDAMAQIPDADLVIAGPSMRVAGFGDYSEFLRGRAQERGVAERVHLVGACPHDEVGALLSAADVVVVPSLRESLNRVCTEAAAAGTPFVVTETTGVAGLMTEAGVGQVVPAGDAGAIATAVRAVLDGKWTRDPAAAARFVAQFEAATAARRLTDFVRRVAG